MNMLNKHPDTKVLSIPDLGSRIRRWRKQNLMKAYEFAKLIKISQGSLSDIENCKSLPSADTLRKIHEHTDLDIIWLLTGKSCDQQKSKYEVQPRVVTIGKDDREILLKVMT